MDTSTAVTERLRKWQEHPYYDSDLTAEDPEALMAEAADEIDLLRKVVQYLSDRIDFRPTNTIWMTGSPIDHAYKRALTGGRRTDV